MDLTKMKEYLEKGTRAFPDEGTIGVPSDWMP